jgi:hypothetical protein
MSYEQTVYQKTFSLVLINVIWGGVAFRLLQRILEYRKIKATFHARTIRRSAPAPPGGGHLVSGARGVPGAPPGIVRQGAVWTGG